MEYRGCPNILANISHSLGSLSKFNVLLNKKAISISKCREMLGWVAQIGGGGREGDRGPLVREGCPPSGVLGFPLRL